MILLSKEHLHQLLYEFSITKAKKIEKCAIIRSVILLNDVVITEHRRKFMKYILEIEEDLLAELKDIAKQSNTDKDTLITAILKAHIISADVFNGFIQKPVK